MDNLDKVLNIITNKGFWGAVFVVLGIVLALYLPNMPISWVTISDSPIDQYRVILKSISIILLSVFSFSIGTYFLKSNK